MSGMKLLTLLHVSDLHIGALKPDGDAPLPPFVLQFDGLEGLLGHHHLGISDLEAFYAQEVGREPDLKLVVSGDLTATGAQDQFELAQDYLERNGGGPGFGMGLAAVDWRDRSVSGNHDQWGGRFHPFSPSHRRLRHVLPGPFPDLGTAVRLADGSKVQFILVDTDADVPAVSVDRGLARGRFRTQLDRLEALLDVPEQGEIRVLVMHHAITLEPPPSASATEPYPQRPWNPLRKLEIDGGTSRQLRDLLTSRSIKVVLTGHLHSPRLSTYSIPKPGGSTDVLEARCGTTTQRDRYTPSQSMQIQQADSAMHRPSRPPLPANTLILHELWRRDDGRREWTARIYTRVVGGGFVGPSDSRAPLPAHQLTRTLVL